MIGYAKKFDEAKTFVTKDVKIEFDQPIKGFNSGVYIFVEQPDKKPPRRGVFFFMNYKEAKEALEGLQNENLIAKVI
jgi:hypothetical protein